MAHTLKAYNADLKQEIEIYAAINKNKRTVSMTIRGDIEEDVIDLPISEHVLMADLEAILGQVEEGEQFVLHNTPDGDVYLYGDTRDEERAIPLDWRVLFNKGESCSELS